MTIQEDEKFKALAHGLVLGCAIPIIAYNVPLALQKKKRNIINLVAYAAFLGFELYSIFGHVEECRKPCADETQGGR